MELTIDTARLELRMTTLFVHNGRPYTRQAFATPEATHVSLYLRGDDGLADAIADFPIDQVLDGNVTPAQFT